MAARNTAPEKDASTSQANSFEACDHLPDSVGAGKQSPDSEAIILPPFRSRPFDRMMKIKKD
jgi:hypothetical protein